MGARLTLEALESLRVVCEHTRKEFRGRTSAKTQVFGLVDSPIPPAPIRRRIR
jgi:hypothetical protein